MTPNNRRKITRHGYIRIFDFDPFETGRFLKKVLKPEVFEDEVNVIYIIGTDQGRQQENREEGIRSNRIINQRDLGM